MMLHELYAYTTKCRQCDRFNTWKAEVSNLTEAELNRVMNEMAVKPTVRPCECIGTGKTVQDITSFHFLPLKLITDGTQNR